MLLSYISFRIQADILLFLHSCLEFNEKINTTPQKEIKPPVISAWKEQSSICKTAVSISKCSAADFISLGLS